MTQHPNECQLINLQAESATMSEKKSCLATSHRDTPKGLRATRFRALVAAMALVLAVPTLQAQTVTRYSYDAGDRIVQITDPRNLVTSYVMDGLGLKWQQVSPDSGTTSYSYDAYGRVATITDANATQTTFSYDAINRVQAITAGSVTHTSSYDACTNGVGRLCSVSDPTGTTSYTYTPYGQLAGRGFSIAGTAYALGYGYNSMGQLVSLVYPDGSQATYTYNLGAVTAVQWTSGSTVVNVASGIDYRAGDGAMTHWTSHNGLVNSLAYDTDGRLTSIGVPGVQSLTFAYDVADRLTDITNGIDADMTQGVGYDDMSRVRSVYSNADNESFQYDANGNRIAQTLNGIAATVSPAASSNQLTGLSGGVSTTYGYDPKGNLTNVNGAGTFQFDAFNRLSAANGWSYYVNPEGQRLRKSNGTSTTFFAPDKGGAMDAEMQGATWIDYVWLNGRVIARASSGVVQSIHSDQVGRPEVVTDGNRAVVWRARNFAFDRTVTIANAVPLNLGFPGQYFDAESGLWNNGFRDYSPSLGRYIESDPAGQAVGINTYAYALSNPVQRTDPRGLDSGYVLSGDIGSLMSGGRKAGGPFVFGALAGETGLGPVHLETESVAIGGYDGQNGAYGAVLSASGAATGYGPYSAAALYGLETMSDGTTVPLTLYEVNIGEGIPGLGKIGLGAGAFKECGKWGFYVHATGGIGNGSGSLGFGVSP